MATAERLNPNDRSCSTPLPEQVSIFHASLISQAGELHDLDAFGAEGFHTDAVGHQEARLSPGDDHSADGGAENQLSTRAGAGLTLRTGLQRAAERGAGQAGVVPRELGQG